MLANLFNTIINSTLRVGMFLAAAIMASILFYDLAYMAYSSYETKQMHQEINQANYERNIKN